jgi:ATP-independent RNA helicase DbpA
MQNNWNYNELVKNALGNELLPLQRDVIETVAKHKDIQVNAPTGSGKTIAFCLGLLEAKKVYKWNKALIIAPTRELVIQIGEVFASLKTGLNYTVCYGGHAFKTEVNNFMGNPDVIIGTPGRICDHIRRESFDFSLVEALVVDEEDKVKELGFLNELNFILAEVKTIKSSIHVSATAIKDKGLFSINHTSKDDASNKFSYFKIEVEEESHKAEALLHLLVSVEPGPTLVFFNHREAADRIAD